MTNTARIERAEERIPMAVAVRISAHDGAPGVETVFTVNVSVRGARVVSARRWQVHDTLQIEYLPGEFRANARVAYCQPQSEGFAVGLEFLEPSGRWVVNAPVASGKPLQG